MAWGPSAALRQRPLTFLGFYDLINHLILMCLTHWVSCQFPTLKKVFKSLV